MTSSHKFHSSILREYDIRGVVGETLFAQDAEAIGKAFGTIVRNSGNHQVAVGFDGRHSSIELEAALVRGLVSVGIDVKRIGRGPTPMLYFATYHLNTDSGIMITGSHNPPSHNGFKMMLNGKPFYGEQIQSMGQMVAMGEFSVAPGSEETVSCFEDYVSRVLKDFAPGRHLNVVWDCGNGATGEVMRAIAAQLPGRHVLLYDDIDGTFPNHHPDPTVADNLQDLIRTVRGVGADLGIAFDGDGDRIGVVDGLGRILWGDQLLAILAREVLKITPGAPIIADVKASQILFDEISALGGTPVMWKTGHSLIKGKMAEMNSPLAGEMSGHIFYADKYYGFDDAPYVGIRLLGLLGNENLSLEELRDRLPEMVNTPELRFDCPDERKFFVIDEVRANLDRAGTGYNGIDGVRVMNEDGWWLLRASNTQAVLVARCESKTKAGLEKLKTQLIVALEDVGLTAPKM